MEAIETGADVGIDTERGTVLDVVALETAAIVVGTVTGKDVVKDEIATEAEAEAAADSDSDAGTLVETVGTTTAWPDDDPPEGLR